MKRAALLTALALALLIPSAASAATTTWYVREGGLSIQPCGTTIATACADVADAVQQAALDDTIDIGPGTFDEGISTGKRLNFVGAGESTRLTGSPAGDPFGMRLRGGGSVTSMQVAGRNASQFFTNGTGLDLTVAGAGQHVSYTLTDVLALGGAPYAGVDGRPALKVYDDGTASQIDLTVNGGMFSGGERSDTVAIAGANLDFDINGAEMIASGDQTHSALDVEGASGSLVASTVPSSPDGVSVSSESADVTVASSTIRATRHALSAGVGATLRFNDSLAVAEGTDVVAAVFLTNAQPSTPTIFRATGSTLVARASDVARGISSPDVSHPPAPLEAHLENTALRAVGTAPNTAAVDAFFDHAGTVTFAAESSSFSDVHGSPGDILPVPGQGSNVAGDPLFVDPAGDFRLQPSSPLIDRGDLAVAGQLDLVGAARSQDGNGDGTTAPDIGAYESPGIAPPEAPGDPGAGTTMATRDLTAPLFKGRLSVKRGLLRYTLSEPAKVSFKLERKLLKKKARSSAVRFRRVKSFSLDASAGRNSTRLSRKLRPGTYRVRLIATDSAGNHSLPRILTFRIAKRKKVTR